MIGTCQRCGPAGGNQGGSLGEEKVNNGTKHVSISHGFRVGHGKTCSGWIWKGGGATSKVSRVKRSPRRARASPSLRGEWEFSGSGGGRGPVVGCLWTEAHVGGDNGSGDAQGAQQKGNEDQGCFHRNRLGAKTID